MRISAAFPSEYLKCADLQGREVTVVIERIEMRDVGDDHKPVLFFKGKERGLVLNKTNSGAIADVLGDETDDWVGASIIVFPTRVDFQGKRVDAIRVRVRVPSRRATAVTENGNGELATAKFDDSEIPF